MHGPDPAIYDEKSTCICCVIQEPLENPEKTTVSASAARGGKVVGAGPSASSEAASPAKQASPAPVSKHAMHAALPSQASPHEM